MKTFALAGNPNCGKTTLFNALTGATAHVGNWPGVTVDKREGIYKGGDNSIAVVDLPGIYSLSPYTPEEVVARNVILSGDIDGIINIVDATNLERNLYLTTQILEMDVPVIIALNMMDEVEKVGDRVDVEKLEEAIGVPVVSISAMKKQGIKKLMERAAKLQAERKGTTVLQEVLGEKIQKAVDFVGETSSSLFHAIKLLENDEIELEKAGAKEKALEIADGEDMEAIVADERYTYITTHYMKAKIKKASVELTKSDKADKVLTHRIFSIPIFLVILFAIFHLTFSENLFYLGGLFKDVTPSFAGTAYEGLLWTDGGIMSPGVIMQQLVIFTTDLISRATADAMANAAPWLSGLLVDGIMGGVFAVLSFVPQILLLFLFFAILEDSGYMARIAFILDRMFRRFGLSGRAFMPMIMGFGCSVPAMVNTRTLADEKERTATLRVIPFFSCGAKAPILIAIAGGIGYLIGVENVDFITYSMYVGGIITAILSVLLMRSTTMRGEVPPFIMELPTYHLPQFTSLMLHLWDKLKHFLQKAFTIILASTIVIWFFSHFSWSWQYLEDVDMNQSILAGIGQFVQPIFTPLGFGSQLTSFGWVFAVAAITGLIAKENVIATFYTLACCIIAGLGCFQADFIGILQELDGEVLTELLESFAMVVNQEDGATLTAFIANLGNYFDGANLTLAVEQFTEIATASNSVELLNYLNVAALPEMSEEGVGEAVAIIQASGIGVSGLLSFIMFNMTTIPCFAAVATAKAESHKGTFKWTLLFWVVTSYLVGTIVYTIGSWWWTAFIWLALGGTFTAVVWLKNHNQLPKLLKRGN